MRRRLTILCTFFSIIISHLGAEIHHCANTSEVLPFFDKITPNTLVIFDIDDTLITKSDKILRPIGNDHRTFYYFRLVQKFQFDHILYLVSLVELNARTQLVEYTWPSIIADLQAKTPFVMGHTAAPPGRMGVFKSFPRARHTTLKSFGIDFSPIKQYYPNIHLTELNHIPDSSPMFYAGTLYSHDYSKGEALATLLKHYDWQPDLVIFVDDLLNNLRSVEKELNKLKIPVLGIHYEESQLYNDTIDLNIAEIQYEYLVDQQQWLNDQEATQLLESKKSLDEAI